jgi:hypothetical protein
MGRLRIQFVPPAVFLKRMPRKWLELEDELEESSSSNMPGEFAIDFSKLGATASYNIRED